MHNRPAKYYVMNPWQQLTPRLHTPTQKINSQLQRLAIAVAINTKKKKKIKGMLVPKGFYRPEKEGMSDERPLLVPKIVVQNVSVIPYVNILCQDRDREI